MTYVDGFVAAVPKDKKEAYLKHAEYCAPIFKEYGALKVVDCWGDEVPHGEVTSFPKAVQAKDDEIVIFSWIIWPSKEVRTAGMEKCMKDPRFAEGAAGDIPFDGKRLIMGSFDMILET